MNAGLFDVTVGGGGTRWCATAAAVQAVGDDAGAWEAVLDRTEAPLARAADRHGRPVRLAHPVEALAVLIVAVEADDGASEIVNLIATWAEVDREGLREVTT